MSSSSRGVLLPTSLSSSSSSSPRLSVESEKALAAHFALVITATCKTLEKENKAWAAGSLSERTKDSITQHGDTAEQIVDGALVGLTDPLVELLSEHKKSTREFMEMVATRRRRLSASAIYDESDIRFHEMAMHFEQAFRCAAALVIEGKYTTVRDDIDEEFTHSRNRYTTTVGNVGTKSDPKMITRKARLP
jgi:hypothetical protein